MANKIRISIALEYQILSVFFDDNTQTDQSPQTTDSSDIEGVVNTVKLSEWVFKILTIDLVNNRILIFKETFTSDNQEVEEIIVSSLSAPQQTIINDFINSL